MRAQSRVNGVLLTAEVIPMGEDLCVAVTGGDRPHLGCAALALPHPGITDPTAPSATVSALNLPAHRDDRVAGGMAKTLSAALARPVAVLCGIHFDHFSPQLAADTERAAAELCDEILGLLEKKAPDPSGEMAD